MGDGNLKHPQRHGPSAMKSPIEAFPDQHRDLTQDTAKSLPGKWMGANQIVPKGYHRLFCGMDVWETKFIQEGQGHLSHHQKIKTMMPTPGRGWHSLWAQAQNRNHDSACRKTSRKGPTENLSQLILGRTTGAVIFPINKILVKLFLTMNHTLP